MYQLSIRINYQLCQLCINYQEISKYQLCQILTIKIYFKKHLQKFYNIVVGFKMLELIT